MVAENLRAGFTLLVIALLIGSASRAADSPADEADRVWFDPERVVQIDLRLAPSDFKSLRRQTRSLGHGYATETFGPAPTSPYTWFATRLEVDGQRLARVGLRKKGFLGSLDEQRPALRLDMARYAKGQKLAGLRRVVLNNGEDGGSWIRQCLGLRVFLAAGYPAPRCGLARVRVNGQELGVYVLVEAIDRAFLQRHFSNPDGLLLEGAGSDFRPRWIDTFEFKTGPQGAARDRLEAVVRALELPDDRVLEALGRVVDLDAFVTYWCLEALIGHLDGYAGFANNFFVYQAPDSGRFHFLPWGLDKIMGYPDRVSPRDELSILTGSVLSVRLWRLPAMRARYAARMRELIAKVWQADRLEAEFLRLEALVKPMLLARQRKALRYSRANLIDFFRRRARLVLDDLDLAVTRPPRPLLAPPTWRVHHREGHQHGPR